MAKLWFQYSIVSEELADRIHNRLRLKINEVSLHPELGRLRPEFGFEGLRSVAVRPHVIFYSVANESVWIHRVVDGRRYLFALFSENEPS